jgi:hypothetical protein
VHLGGHVQTGGYGQLSRAFGLFSDHIVSFEMIFADGTKRKIEPTSPDPFERDLFFAVLGGGPGNYGIMTHVSICPLKDSDYPDARAYKHIIPYDPKFDHHVLVKLFDLVREWEEAPGDYDFCVTVASAEENFIGNQIGLASVDDFMVTFFGGKNDAPPFNIILVYFQYSNTDKNTPYDPTWCQKIQDILKTANTGGSIWERITMLAEQEILNLLVKHQDNIPTPISTSITELWTYPGTREFNFPYIKNGQDTDTVASDDWSEWAATRIDAMTGRSDEGLMVFVQCQNFGGQGSAIVKNGKRNQTSFAWRNTTVGYNLDVFYDPKKPDAKEKGQEWQKVNTEEGIGQNGKFSTEDHRWFWASHGDLNMKNVWQYYYSSREMYDRCCEVKKQVDPNGVFSPNSFVVGYSLDVPDRSVFAGSQPEKIFDDAEFAKSHADLAHQCAKEKGINVDKYVLKFR